MNQTFNKNNPCTRDCPNRCCACHDTCKRYAAFIDERNAQKEWLNHENGVGIMNTRYAMKMIGYNKSKHRSGGNAGAKFYGMGA